MDLKVEHGTISRVAAAAGQAILVIPVGLQILAPGLAPEAARDGTAVDDHGRRLAAALGQSLHQALAIPRRALAPLGHAWTADIVPPAHLIGALATGRSDHVSHALRMSSATTLS